MGIEEVCAWITYVVTQVSMRGDGSCGSWKSAATGDNDRNGVFAFHFGVP